jgi:hypothetical protein
MLTKKQVRRALRFAEPVLVEQFGRDQAQKMLLAMKASYQDLAPGLPQLKNDKSRMVLRIAVDTLAFYRILPPDMPQETRLHLAQEFVNNWMDGQFDRWIARKVYANPFLHRLYRFRWFRSANKADEPDGQRFEIVAPKGNLFYGINVTRCGVVKYLAQEGAPELARLICQGDFHIQKYLPKHVEFRRSQVIAEGGQYCDFRYYFTEK